MQLENVELQRNVNDSRVLRINLTDKCFTYLESKQSKEEEFFKSLYAGINNDEINYMFSIMKKLEKILNLD